MSNFKANTLVAAGLVLAGLGSPLMAQAQATDYWNGNTVLRSGFDLCWRAGYWSQANAACDPALAPKPVAAAPAPKAAPAPAPAPVAAPAPAPAPVVAPAPAPADAWKTVLVEKPVRLEGANFATGSSKLLKGANSKLDEVVKVAKTYPEVELDVSGHTDSTGNAKANQKLSQARAEAVKAYLVKQGVASSRISVKGHGADQPVADNKTAAGRAQNRRVEVRYVLKEESKVRVTK